MPATTRAMEASSSSRENVHIFRVVGVFGFAQKAYDTHYLPAVDNNVLPMYSQGKFAPIALHLSRQPVQPVDLCTPGIERDERKHA